MNSRFSSGGGSGRDVLALGVGREFDAPDGALAEEVPVASAFSSLARKAWASAVGLREMDFLQKRIAWDPHADQLLQPGGPTEEALTDEVLLLSQCVLAIARQRIWIGAKSSARGYQTSRRRGKPTASSAFMRCTAVDREAVSRAVEEGRRGGKGPRRKSHVLSNPQRALPSSFVNPNSNSRRPTLEEKELSG